MPRCLSRVAGLAILTGGAALTLTREARAQDAYLPSSSTSSSSEGAADAPLPTIPPARLSFGAQAGYGSPLGLWALDVDWYPFRWMGFEGSAAMPVLGTPTTFAQGIRFGWTLADLFEQGAGVGVAEALVSDVGVGGRRGMVTYLTTDVFHFTFFLGRAFSIRTEMDLAFPVSGGDFCDKRPDSCARLLPVSTSVTLFWNFDVSHGQS